MPGSIRSIFRPNLFKGKVAIVTGGATGIGQAIVTELLHLGCRVMIASRKVKRLEKAAEAFRKQIQNSEINYVKCNIREEEEVKNMISTTLSKYGKLDYLINNGGGQFLSRSEKITINGWNSVIETNLTGTFLCCREAYNQYMQKNGGAIVNIIADMWKGFPLMSHTGAARAGVHNLTKSLAVEWAESGVRINCVAPGIIYSETAAANYKDVNVFQLAIPLIPAKRLGKPEEVSAAVSFLLSPAAAFITGETIKVDGASSLYTAMYQVPDHAKMPAYSWSDEVEDDDLFDEPHSTNLPKSKL